MSNSTKTAAVAGVIDSITRKLIRRHPHVFKPEEAQGVDTAGADPKRAHAEISRGASAALLGGLYDKMSGEPFEKLAGVLELAGEWTRAAGVEQGATFQALLAVWRAGADDRPGNRLQRTAQSDR